MDAYGDEVGAAHLASVDPTKALWRRIFAYVIDALVGTLVVLVVVAALGDAETVESPRCPDPLPDDRTCIDGSSVGANDDDEVILVDTAALIGAVAAWLGWVVVNDVVLQGWTGATVGKFITAARVVRPDGHHPGAGRALVRTLLLIVDGISLILPLGLWTAMFSRGHRRLGDMVANTYVVKAQYAGRPVVLPPRP